jgi:hypothetical protein
MRTSGPSTLPLALLAAAAIACSSSGTPDPGAGPTPAAVRVQVGATDGVRDESIRRSDPTGEHALDAAPDAVWRVLPLVYDELGIPVTTLVTDARRIGNPAFRTRRRLGGEPLSRYLDCGSRMGGRNADSFDVTLRVETMVRPAEQGAVLVTTIDATARPVTGGGDPVNCSSTGRLESRLVEMIRARLAR